MALKPETLALQGLRRGAIGGLLPLAAGVLILVLTGPGSSVFALDRGEPRILVSVPCNHLRALECSEYEFLAAEITRTITNSPEIADAGQYPVVPCEEASGLRTLSEMIRCYRVPPEFLRANLSDGFAAVIVFLFEPSEEGQSSEPKGTYQLYEPWGARLSQRAAFSTSRFECQRVELFDATAGQMVKSLLIKTALPQHARSRGLVKQAVFHLPFTSSASGDVIYGERAIPLPEFLTR